ncbi:MAG TPA: DUF4159 domain-containing protein [Saprospiraceae bacterium]|nr:DUF4159 domain-containing protein [Saprospiraceae bacterium]
MKNFLFIIFTISLSFTVLASPPIGIKIALLKYNGGGDWYSVVDALQNLSKFCNQNLGTNFDPDYATVDVGSAEIFNFPFLFLTGHGNIVLTDLEAENLRNYMKSGGFIFIDDDFGLDPFIRPALKKVFPALELKEIPFTHPLYHQKYDFPKGLPKVHKHNDKAPQGLALILDGRMVCFYDFESNISDGWESEEVHKDALEIRQAALKMGANIIQFAFTQ